jgi:hypothetical protein
MKLTTQIVLILFIALAALLLISIFSSGDMIGALSDVTLKMFYLATKMIFFAIFMLIMVQYLKFAEIFEKASQSTPHGLKAVAAAIIVLAFAFLLIGY